MSRSRWRVRVGDDASGDLIEILEYTRDTFGDHQFAAYTDTLLAALASLEEGPDVLGSLARDEILPGLRSLHVARRGRRGRHFLLYRPAEGQVIEVVRILHDRTELARHFRKDED